jgi:Phage integrase family
MQKSIRQLLEFADLRLKCIILLMSSAGLRRGAIPSLRIGDLQKIDKYSLYKISVYKNEQEAYFTFCTPECAKLLDQYFDYRARLGEKIHEKSPVFRKEFTTLDAAKPRPLGIEAISWLVNVLLDRSGIRPKQEKKKIGGEQRTSVMQCHGFRKYFETTARLAGMDLVFINRCMGHSTGLEHSYLKLSDQQILEGNDKMIGYIGVIDELTINEENRLKRQVETLTIKKSEIEQLKQRDKTSADVIATMQEQLIKLQDEQAKQQKLFLATGLRDQKLRELDYITNDDERRKRLNELIKDGIFADLEGHYDEYVKKMEKRQRLNQ